MVYDTVCVGIPMVNVSVSCVGIYMACWNDGGEYLYIGGWNTSGWVGIPMTSMSLFCDGTSVHGMYVSWFEIMVVVCDMNDWYLWIACWYNDGEVG